MVVWKMYLLSIQWAILGIFCSDFSGVLRCLVFVGMSSWLPWVPQLAMGGGWVKSPGLVGINGSPAPLPLHHLYAILGMMMGTRERHGTTGSWVVATHIFFVFIPKFGEMIQLDDHICSDGLKPPTRQGFTEGFGWWAHGFLQSYIPSGSS